MAYRREGVLDKWNIHRGDSAFGDVACGWDSWAPEPAGGVHLIEVSEC